MGIRTPLGNAIGLGSGHNGFHHWWTHFLSMVGYCLLCIFAIYAVISFSVMEGGYQGMLAWMANPFHAVLSVLFVVVGFYHFALCARVCIEDYIQPEWFKMTCIVATNFLATIFSLVACFSILRMFLGG